MHFWTFPDVLFHLGEKEWDILPESPMEWHLLWKKVPQDVLTLKQPPILLAPNGIAKRDKSRIGWETQKNICHSVTPQKGNYATWLQRRSTPTSWAFRGEFRVRGFTTAKTMTVTTQLYNSKSFTIRNRLVKLVRIKQGPRHVLLLHERSMVMKTE